MRMPGPEIQRKETQIKRSIKEAGKRGDMSSCKMYAKEIVRSRKAVNRLETSKAQMNSVMMNVEMQVSQGQMIKRMGDTAGVMKMMNKLAKVEGVQETMMAMQQEMQKVNYIAACDLLMRGVSAPLADISVLAFASTGWRS